MELHTAQREKKLTQPRFTKLSKKEKKKQKESKKLAKLKKVDADKVIARLTPNQCANRVTNNWFLFQIQDADESEMKVEHGKDEKKKKKKFLF